MRTSSLEMFNRYLQLQAAIKEKATQPQQPSITISRESGAGASTVAQMVVQHLNAIKTPTGNAVPWTVFDKNLAKEVIVEHKLPLELEKFMVEDARLPVQSVVEELLGLHSTSSSLVQQTTKTILRLASLGRVVIVGRGAEVATQLLPYVLHVRLLAPLSKRINQAAQFYGLSPNGATQKVSEEDEARSSYLRRYFNADSDNPFFYHLILNTAKTGFAEAAELIVQSALRQHQAFLQSQQSLRAA